MFNNIMLLIFIISSMLSRLYEKWTAWDEYDRI